MENEFEFLPIGTICRLKNGIKNVMVAGFCPVTNDGEGAFDYLGAVYPEGIVTTEVSVVFDHNQIEEVLFMGYVDEEEKKFKKRLNESIKALGKLENDDESENDNQEVLNTDLFNTNN